MNAPTLNELRNGIPTREFSARDLPVFEPRDLADEKMNQVRDLLVEDFIRESQSRMMAMETRVRDLEVGLGQRLTVLSQRIESLAADHSVDRQSALDELAKHVLDLGDKIRAIPR